MGKGQSKEGKGDKGKDKNKSKPAKKSTKSEPKETTTVSNNASTQNNNNSDAAPEQDIDWNSPTLYSKNNAKVGVDDFEYLKVIGKGSFGKVSETVFH